MRNSFTPDLNTSIKQSFISKVFRKIQLLSWRVRAKKLGAVIYIDAREADGLGPLTGAESPWKDLAGDNDGTLTNFDGTIASGWNGDPAYLTFDNIDDFIKFANTASMDITEPPIIMAFVSKLPTQATTQYLITRNLDTSTTMQYGMAINNITYQVRFEGGIRHTFNLQPNVFYNILVCWDGSNIDIIIDDVPNSNAVYSAASLTSQPNTQFGARSSAVDGSSQLFFIDGDVGAFAMFHESGVLDITAIRQLWKEIAAEYLATNP